MLKSVTDLPVVPEFYGLAVIIILGVHKFASAKLTGIGSSAAAGEIVRSSCPDSFNRLRNA